MSLFKFEGFNNVEEIERFEPECSHIPDQYSWYDINECCIRVVANESFEWGNLILELDCVDPPDNHFLSYEFDAVGSLNDIIGIHIDDTKNFLIENGIAPSQPFYIHLKYFYTTRYYGDIDTDITCEIVSIVPWSKERVLNEWEAFYGRSHLLVFG